MHRSPILALIGAFALSACGSPEPVKALPPAFIDVAMEAAFAETIADECGPISYNTAYERQVLEREAMKLAAAGYTRRDLDAAAGQIERDPAIQMRAFRMINDRKIDPSSERSWCAAGKREVQRKTKIGRYLLL
jgi:hypothetical protein